MSHLTLHSDINTERIDNPQEIEVWPETCVKMPQFDYMYPVWQAGGKDSRFGVCIYVFLAELQSPVGIVNISGIETISFYPC